MPLDDLFVFNIINKKTNYVHVLLRAGSGEYIPSLCSSLQYLLAYHSSSNRKSEEIHGGVSPAEIAYPFFYMRD